MATPPPPTPPPFSLISPAHVASIMHFPTHLAHILCVGERICEAIWQQLLMAFCANGSHSERGGRKVLQVGKRKEARRVRGVANDEEIIDGLLIKEDLVWKTLSKISRFS